MRTPDDMKRNASGYYDPTAYEAYRHIEKEKAARLWRVLTTLRNVAKLAGFEIVGRIVLKDIRTGEEFR